MKKIYFLIILASMAFVLAGCPKDPDPAPPEEPKVEDPKPEPEPEPEPEHQAPKSYGNDPNVLKSEIDDIRKSVVSMSVGQPGRTSTIVKEWLEQPAPAPPEPEEESDSGDDGDEE